MAVLPASELMLMTLPAPAARIPGSTAFTIRTAPKKFVSSCALASSTLVSSAAPVIEYPALLTSTSRRPALATTCSTQERTDSSERTSSATMVTPCECVLSGLRAVPKTLNPRSASSRAVAWPMPDEAPVTRMVCDMESPKGYAPHNAQWAIIVPSLPGPRQHPFHAQVSASRIRSLLLIAILRRCGTSLDPGHGMNLPRRRPPAIPTESSGMLRSIGMLVVPEQPARYSHPVMQQRLVQRLGRPILTAFGHERTPPRRHLHDHARCLAEIGRICNQSDVRVHERRIRRFAVHGLPRAPLHLDHVADDRCATRFAPAVRVIIGLHDRGDCSARIDICSPRVDRPILLAVRLLAMHASRHTLEGATVKHFRWPGGVRNSWLEAYAGLLDHIRFLGGSGRGCKHEGTSADPCSHDS